jgi:D-arginine utilization repressor
MPHPLERYIPICDAVAQLFWPHAEAVLHDLATGKIFYIANPYSKRRVGDTSLNDPGYGYDRNQAVIGPYGKTNWDGHRLKSVTTVLKDGRNQSFGLLCINHDIEAFAGIVDQFKNLIEIPPSTLAAPLLTEDWREAVNRTIQEFLSWRKMTMAGLTLSDTQDLIKTLDERGIFEIRNAVPYVADILRVTRATIYNRLSAARKNRHPLTSTKA